MAIKVVILAYHSLLADGIANLLVASANLFDTYLVDAAAKDAIEQILEIDPDVVIVDAMDMCAARKQVIENLMAVLPQGVVLQIDTGSDLIKIFSFVSRQVNQIEEVASIIRGVGESSQQEAHCLPFYWDNNFNLELKTTRRSD